MATGILIVEDERIIAKGIEKRLKGLGYDVVGAAATGEDAVRKVDELRPDLVLMDINLGPGIDGIEAAEIIRRRTGVPVVYLTAHSDDATLTRAKLTEPFGYVLKPFEDKDLQTAVEIGLYRHRAERRLRENEQWLAATLSSIGDGVIATDDAGRVRFMNALAERLTGWPQAEALGRDVREVFPILHERDRFVVPNPIFEALARGEPVGLAPHTSLVTRSGAEIAIDDSAAPIRDLAGRVSGAVLVFRDVTERRRLEEHLRQAQKMEAIGRLAGGIAHDFNNIMTVVNGFSEMLLDGDPSPEDRRLFARNILEAGKRAAGLTQQIMAFSRQQMLVPCVLDLNAIVRDVGAMVRRLIGEPIELVVDLASDLGAVRADPTQVAQVILNLAANARDAMPDGGRLTLSTANVTVAAEAATRHGVKPGGHAMLAVSDTGVGMSEEVLERIFEPFFTTKGIGAGTGLGLATVYGIVKQSGGHVDVVSRLGEGSTFRVYLPLVDEPQVAPDAATARDEKSPVGRETLLLVEDEAAVRRMTRQILDQQGYRVLEAADGSEALAVAAGHSGPLDLLLTDLVMPKLSGRETAERLTALRPGLKVLFMSGYTDDVILRHGVASAESNFLHKPFTVASLTRKIRDVLDGR